MHKLKTPLPFFLFILFSFAVIIYLSCKKSEQARPAPVHAENKAFFTVPVNTNTVVTAIINALNRENEKFPFAETMAKNAGYPQWKYAKTKKGNASSREQGDVEIINIPLVKQHDNSTDAILVVKINGGDTVFNLLYKQDYIQYSLDSASPQPSARDFFNVFITFDYDLFGVQKYLINDGRIFGYNQGDTLTATVERNVEEQSRVRGEVGNSQNAFFSQVCNTVTVCHSMQPPTAKAANRDLLCTTTTNCAFVWVDDGSGLAGSGGGGSSGAGTGGNSSTGTTTGGGSLPTLVKHSPCQRSAVINGKLPTNTDPCNAQPWTPVNPPKTTQNNIDQQWLNNNMKDSTGNRCYTSVINTLKQLTHSLPEIFRRIFDSSANINITFKSAPLSEAKGAETTTNYTSNDFKITINTKYPNATSLSVASTILHELIHAQLMNWYRIAITNNDTNMQKYLATEFYLFFDSTTVARYPGLSFQFLMNQNQGGQHQIITMANIRQSISDVLYAFSIQIDPNTTVDALYCDVMAWSGTNDSKAFKSLPKDEQTRLNDVIEGERGNNNDPNFIQKGKSCP